MAYMDTSRSLQPPERGFLAFLSRHPWAVAAATILALLAAAAVLLNLVAVSALERQIAAIRAAGEPLTLDEIKARRPTVTDDENLAPLVLEAAQVIQAAHVRWNAARQGDPSKNHLPMLGTSRFQPRLAVRWPPEILEAIRTLLISETNAMATFHRAGQMSVGRYPIAWKSPPLEMILPHLSLHRVAIKTLCLESILAAHDGRVEEAVQALDCATRIGRSLVGEPFLISALVLQSCDALTIDAAVTVINLCEPGPEMLARLAACAQEMEARFDLREALLGERVHFYEFYLCLRETGSLSSLISTGTPTPPGTDLLPKLFPGWVMLDAANGLKFYNRFFVAASQSEAAARDMAQQNEQEFTNQPVYYVLSRVLMPSFSRVITLTMQNRARTRLCRAVVAAEKYRLDRGEYPEDLAELVPDFLDAVPIDPLTDEPLRYLREPDGIIVWFTGDTPPDEDDTHPLQQRRSGDRRVAIRILNPPLRGVIQDEGDLPNR